MPMPPRAGGTGDRILPHYDFSLQPNTRREGRGRANREENAFDDRNGGNCKRRSWTVSLSAHGGDISYFRGEGRGTVVSVGRSVGRAVGVGPPTASPALSLAPLFAVDARNQNQT